MSWTSPIRNTNSRSAEREQLRDRINLLIGQITNAQDSANPNHIPILHPRTFGLKAEVKRSQLPGTQSPINTSEPNLTVPAQVLIELRDRIMELGQHQAIYPKSVAKARTEERNKMLSEIAEWRLRGDAQKRLKLKFHKKARSLAKAKEASTKSFQVETPTENFLPEATERASLAEESSSEEKLSTSLQTLGIDPMDVETEELADQMDKWERDVNASRYSLSDEDEVIW
jgi:hypothetical protein